MRYTIYVNIKVLLSEPHIFLNEAGRKKKTNNQWVHVDVNYCL